MYSHGPAVSRVADPGGIDPDPKVKKPDPDPNLEKQPGSEFILSFFLEIISSYKFQFNFYISTNFTLTLVKMNTEIESSLERF